MAIPIAPRPPQPAVQRVNPNLTPTQAQIDYERDFAAWVAAVANSSSSGIPFPTSTTIGGVKAATASTHQFQRGIDTSGNPLFAQPATGDISGLGPFATGTTVPAASVTGLATVATTGQVSDLIGSLAVGPPTPTTLGGIYSSDAPAFTFCTGVDTSGNFQYREPSFNDIAGLVLNSQMPFPGGGGTLGGVKSLRRAASGPHAFLTEIDEFGNPFAIQPDFTDISGTTTAAQGGTGQTSYAIGDLLYASSSAALSKLADVATGNALISGGVGAAPLWGKITTSHTTGIAASGVNTDITSLSGLTQINAPAANFFIRDSTNGSSGMYFDVSTGGTTNGSFIFRSSNSFTTLATIGATSIVPGTDNTSSMGNSAFRWSVVYSATGAINTSDARQKTDVVPLSDRELSAAQHLAKEIGTFQFLDAIAKKGKTARTHVGMTVQRAIEVMRANELDPFSYAFICHDKWDATLAKDAVLDEDGNILHPAEPARPAGDSFGFRPDELMLFLAQGFEARLRALEKSKIG